MTKQWGLMLSTHKKYPITIQKCPCYTQTHPYPFVNMASRIRKDHVLKKDAPTTLTNKFH